MTALFLWLTGLSLFDIRYRKVPVWLLVLGGGIAVFFGIRDHTFGAGSFEEFLFGMIPGLILLLLALGTRMAGWADGIVLMLSGGILGFRQCILASMLSLILISILSALLLILKKVHKGTRIPYIPFLTMGLTLCMITGGLI